MRIDPFSTHQALFLAAMLQTRGPILEMGGGYYSTPLVSAVANFQRREAHTIETGAAVYERLKRYASPFHTIWPVAGYDFEPSGKFIPRRGVTRAQYVEIQSRFLEGFCRDHPRRWSVVFVDHAPGYLRAPAIEHFAHMADFIVTHDTELTEAYGFEPCLSSFRYRWDARLHVPHATVVSHDHPCDVFRAVSGLSALA